MGADIGVTKRLTLAFDFLGTYVIDSPRLVRETFTAANGQTFPQIGFVTESYNLANGAAGLKFNPGRAAARSTSTSSSSSTAPACATR